MKIDQIIRSSRKTIALIVQRDGQLIIRAPYRASKAQIMQFVEQKATWIQTKQAEARQRTDQIQSHQFKPGERFFYLGQSYPLVISLRSRPALELTQAGFQMAQSAQPAAAETFTRWYQKQARLVLGERLQLYAARYRLNYKKLNISSARTRWGSCSTTGTISFTWRLVMAPLEVIDYVVIHELAHLIEADHSSRFWAEVGRMLPDYAKCVNWLKQNGHLLTLE